MHILQAGRNLATLAFRPLLGLLACFFVAEVPAVYVHVASPPPDVRAALAASGISTDAYAIYMTVWPVVAGVVGVAAAALLSVRLPRSAFVRLVSLMLALGATASPPNLSAAVDMYPAAEPLARLAQTLWQLTTVAFLFLFPDGRSIPGWTRLPLWLLLAAIFVGSFAVPGSMSEPSGPVFLLWLVGDLGGIAVLAYRYARRSSQVERQQTKWVVLGGGIAVAIGVLSPFLEPFVPSPFPEELRSTPYDALSVTSLTLVFLLVPISITLAVLRYRLWDVDVFIKRTLVYGALTALLGLTYWASVAVLQQVLRPLTQGSDLAIVGSTLAVAALFQPLRQRIQHAVDRRFYRQQYDSVRTLEAFSSRLREQVDLDSLGAELLAVVGQTMQPERVSLWLRPPVARSGGR